ncbi:DUF502 domain-containing protein [Niveibacterium umoris]|uniref:Putative membrane protein n=1 Tax=Niveibacterium umoris TaxID=1193620 RepID=A0A840BI44_9RHOO|nr:DUF502 domain-containing protein [Niveibacterium umoris]MBB4012303.1 putative membrane protein [Niveibacterium umoris]
MPFKKYLIAGLLVWVPLTITVWVLHLIVGTLDQSLLLLPSEWRPAHLIGVDIPGFGAILTLLVVVMTGVVVANYFGQRVIGFWESLLARIPVVKSIYSSVKQVSDTLFAPNGQAFRKALLVQYPREGSWTVGFLTGAPSTEVARHLPGEHVSVYIPTTPNPTSGFFLMMHKEAVVELEMSVDDALKYIISMGVVAPGVTNSNSKR